MDTTAIAMRLRKLDSYLRTSQQIQAAPLDEYLNDNNIQTIVELNLQIGDAWRLRLPSNRNTSQANIACEVLLTV